MLAFDVEYGTTMFNSIFFIKQTQRKQITQALNSNFFL
jgi:hypothetical protein